MNYNPMEMYESLEIEHLRDKNDNLYATVVTVRYQDDIAIGISICNEYDEFSHIKGIMFASHRAKCALELQKCSEPIINSHFKNVKLVLGHPRFILPYKSIYRKLK